MGRAERRDNSSMNSWMISPLHFVINYDDDDDEQKIDIQIDGQYGK